MITFRPSATPFAADIGIRHAALPRPQPPGLDLWGLLAFWLERSHQREALREVAELSPHLLDDIGLTRAEAIAEADKPFWR